MPLNDTDTPSSNPWMHLLFALLAAAALIALDLLTKSPVDRFTREGGGVEVASALLYGYAAAVWLWLRPGAEWRRSWQIPVVMLMMMGREFDLDKKVTTVGILKSNLYLTGEAPVPERVLGVLVIAFTAAVLIRLVRVNGKSFMEGLRQRSLWAWSVLAGIGLAVVSKSIDGLGRKLAPLGIEISPQVDAMAVVFEELFEMGIPIMFLIAAIHNFTSLRRNARSARQEA